jgi:hypothetical protein
MKTVLVLAGSLLTLTACGHSIATAIPGGTPAASTVESTPRHETRRAPRAIRVPPGHYPRASQCRLWYEGTPPGRQPRATECRNLIGRVPDGAFILHGGRAWDAEYDWRGHNRKQPGSVPNVIVELTGRNRD